MATSQNLTKIRERAARAPELASTNLRVEARRLVAGLARQISADESVRAELLAYADAWARFAALQTRGESSVRVDKIDDEFAILLGATHVAVGEVCPYCGAHLERPGWGITQCKCGGLSRSTYLGSGGLSRPHLTYGRRIQVCRRKEI